MAISNLTPVEEWPTRKLPQDRFDDAVKTAMDQMSVMIGELNSAFIPQTNEAVEVINKISPNIDTILDAPNQAAAAAASAQSASSSKTAAAQSASEAAASKNAAASSASSASSSKTAAAQSATEAADSASSASSSKTAAAQSASAAAASEESAASSASSATASKTAAAQSATEAAQSATEAAASAQSAASSKTAAAKSAATASSEADRAGGEADRAKMEADRAASVADVDVASNTKAGIIKTDSKTLFVTDQYGTLTAEDVAIDGVLTDTARGRGQIGKCYPIPNSGVDFNTLTNAGRYWFPTRAIANSTNKPPTNLGGFCDVLGYESDKKYTKQIYHVYKAPTVFIREYSGSTSGWSESWTKIITENSIATTEEAGLVKPDGVSLKMVDDAGKMVVEDVLFNNSISLTSSGLLGKARYIASSESFNIDTDDFDLIVINGLHENRLGTYPPFTGFVYVRQYYYLRTSPTSIGNRMQVAFAYTANKMWRRYYLDGSWSPWVKVVDGTDLATTTTPGIVKVGRGLKTTGDGTLSYAGMSAATLDVGGNTRLNASSARNFVLTATGASPNVLLPEPSSLYAGEQFTFFVEGDNILVRDFKGQTVGPALTRGKAYLFTLINRTTGEWARAEFSASGISGDDGSLGFQPSISAPVIFSNVAEAYSTDIELETGRVLHFGSSESSNITGGMLSLVSVTGWSAVSVKNTSLTLPQDFILSDFLKLSSSLCCVLAKDTTTNKKFAVIPVDVSGEAAVVGTENILTTTGTLGNPIFSRVDDAHALLVYGDGTSLYASLYSFSGSTVTAATPVLVREASSTDINKLNIQRMDDTRWLLWTGGFVLQVLGVSGTAITVGEPVTFTPDASWTSSGFSAVSPAPGGDVLVRFTYSYKGSALQTVTVYALLVYTSSGLALTKGTSTEIPDTYKSAAFLNIDGHMFLWYYSGSGSYTYYLVPVTVDSGTATVGVAFKLFTVSKALRDALTILKHTEDVYTVMGAYIKDYEIYRPRGTFTIAPDGSLTESDPPGPAASISNITWGLNPSIQAFPGGRYVYSAGYTRSQSNSDVGYTTVSVLNSSFTKLCEASVDGFVSKPYAGSSISISSPYLYPSVFPTGEYQVLVILNNYTTKKPAWALFTI